MEYVMVPVPEELAARVLTFVSWKDAQANTAPPGAEGPDVVDHDDAVARAFARGSTTPVVRWSPLSPRRRWRRRSSASPTPARRAGVSTREALGILMEVNNVIGDEGGLPITFGRKGVDEPTPGEFAWDAWTVAMPEAAARAVRRPGSRPRPGLSRHARCALILVAPSTLHPSGGVAAIYEIATALARRYGGSTEEGT